MAHWTEDLNHPLTVSIGGQPAEFRVSPGGLVVEAPEEHEDWIGGLEGDLIHWAGGQQPGDRYKMTSISLIGRKFHRLLVVKKASKSAGKLFCLCDCGKVTLARGADLLSGNRRSCGCSRVRDPRPPNPRKAPGRRRNPTTTSLKGTYRRT